MDYRLTAALIATLCAAAFVPSTADAAGRTIHNQKILNIQTGWGYEGIFFGTNTVAATENGCGGAYYILKPTNPFFKEILTLLLSAKQSGDLVDIYTENCQGTNMEVQSVNLH